MAGVVAHCDVLRAKLQGQGVLNAFKAASAVNGAVLGAELLHLLQQHAATPAATPGQLQQPHAAAAPAASQLGPQLRRLESCWQEVKDVDQTRICLAPVSNSPPAVPCLSPVALLRGDHHTCLGEGHRQLRCVLYTR